MKPSLTNSLLDEARSAETAGRLGEAIDKIRERIGAMIVARDYLQRNLQDAIVLGRDQAKAQAALTAHDSEATMLEEAVEAFTRKQEHLQRQQTASELAALKVKAEQTAEQLDAETKAWAFMAAELRAKGQTIAGLATALDRQNAQLEGQRQRVSRRASTIVREAVGDIPSTPFALQGWGRRNDERMVEMLTDNPSILRRRQNPRRGRFGESNAAKDQVAYGMPTGVRA
jgi:hypothetical protein